MENFMNQMRTKFTGLEENKADHGGTNDQKIIPIQKTQSFKGEKKKGQSWLSKFGRRMSRDYDSRDMDMEHAAAVAAAAFAIDSKEDTEQKKKSETREASLSKTKSKIIDGTKSPVSLLGSASKRLSGSFRSTTGDDDQGNKMPISSVTDEKKPEKSITPAPSMRKSSTLTDKKPEFPPPPPPPQPIGRTSSTKKGPVRPPTPTRSGIGDRKADEWERTELEKIRERHEKLKTTIDSWENKKKVNAKRKLNKEEGELELRRMKALENFQTNMKYIDQIASGARTRAEERRRNEEQKAKEKANVIRRTGKLPGICLCF